MKYIVYVQTSCAATGQVTVEAKSEEDAREIARDMDSWEFQWTHDLSGMEGFDIDAVDEEPE